MKKFIAYLLVALMCVSSLAACGKDEKVNEDLQAAANYVYAMYKDAGTVTAKDFERTAQVMIGGTAYTVEWTTDNDAVKVTVADKIATIDVDEKSAEEVAYTLTATIKDADGNTVTKEFKYTVPKFEGYEKIVKDAYALEAGATLDGTFTLEGVILSVDTPYDASYKNVTVTIQIGDLADYPIMCYRLKDGEGVTAAETIKIGDTITVTGQLTNYNGTIEFTSGCTLDKVVEGTAPAPEVPTVPAGATQEEIVDIAYTLISGQALATSHTLTGVITKVDTAYDANYGNVTVTIQVGDKADKLIQCFRMKGDGADKVAVGDTITVTGTLKNYSGTIEFDAGCTLDSYTAGSTTTKPSESTKPSETESQTQTGSNDKDNVKDEPSTSQEDIVKAAYALEKNTSLSGTQTLTGVVTSIDTVYSEQYENITVTIQVGNLSDKKIQCFRMKGANAGKILVGDTVTVTGTIKNYNGTVEFDAGCTLDSYTASKNPEPVYATQAEIVNAAFALKEDYSLSREYTLTGTVKSIDTAYSADYENITITITVEGKDIVCYRLKGDGASAIKEGDSISVKGLIKNYKGTVEFVSGCTIAK